MPKIKTNRLAKKKFKVGGTGRVKHARANTSHNTGKKSAKRMRNLRGTTVADKTARKALEQLLPNATIK